MHVALGHAEPCHESARAEHHELDHTEGYERELTRELHHGKRL